MSNDGGPAFPSLPESIVAQVPPDLNLVMQTRSGMSLKQCYSGLAMMAILHASMTLKEPAKVVKKAADKQGIEPEDVIAKAAIDMANSMLKQERLDADQGDVHGDGG